MHATERTRAGAFALLIATFLLAPRAEAQEAPAEAEAPEPEPAEAEATEPAPAEPEATEPEPAEPEATEPEADARFVAPTDDVPPTPPPAAEAADAGPAWLRLGPAPIDYGSFPPLPPAAPEARPPHLELHGFVAAWWTPWSETSPTAAADAFRLRFAVLRVDARPVDKVSALLRLGLMLPDSPLLDAAVTYAPHDAFAITAGQFRLPLGAAATTLAPALVMLDRPGYVYAMTKLAFRDVGVMVHSGPRGIADGLLHYRLAVTGGGGRFGSGNSRPPGAVADYLYVGRVLLDLGRLFPDRPRDRLVLGATYAHSHDPAIDAGDPARDRELAASVLGRTLAPIGVERDTQLVGGDLTLAMAPAWLQAEALYMHSRAVDASARREAFGASVEAAYTLPMKLGKRTELQVATRFERFDPDLATSNDQQNVLSLGVNVLGTPIVRGSVFYSNTWFEDAATGDARHGGQLTLRMAAGF